MMSVTNKPFMVSDDMPNVIMLSVVMLNVVALVSTWKTSEQGNLFQLMSDYFDQTKAIFSLDAKKQLISALMNSNIWPWKCEKEEAWTNFSWQDETHSRNGCMSAMHLCSYSAKQPNLK